MERKDDMDALKICFTCANCSEHHPDMKDVCGIDNHEVKDVFQKGCKSWTKAKDCGALVEIEDFITINGTKYRVLRQDSGHFCLNSLEKGGCVCHVAWTMAYLQNYFAEEAIRHDVTCRTAGIYNLCGTV